MDENSQVRKELNDFKVEVLTQLAVINSKLDGYPETKKLAFDANTRSIQNEKEIQEMKDRNKWLKNTTLGAIITAIIALGFTFIKVGLGVQ